jgi:predicted 2-oxoglutarate/Fe(II)-dependent dioxygenase YbiX
LYLTTEELAGARGLFDKAQFVDGRVTAGEMAAKVKNNLQLGANAQETQVLTGIVHDALHRNPLFVSAALPKVVCPPLFNRYVPGMEFGIHVDNAIRVGAVTFRTDVSGTLFEPECRVEIDHESACSRLNYPQEVWCFILPAACIEWNRSPAATAMSPCFGCRA